MSARPKTKASRYEIPRLALNRVCRAMPWRNIGLVVIASPCLSPLAIRVNKLHQLKISATMRAIS